MCLVRLRAHCSVPILCYPNPSHSMLPSRSDMLKRSRSGEEDIIRVTIWPEPFNLLRTPDDLKETLDVPLTAEGVDQARLWINEQYESRRDHWLESLRRSWIE